jgi:hypothetical protein
MSAHAMMIFEFGFCFHGVVKQRENLVKIVTKQRRKRQQVNALADHLTTSVLSALKMATRKQTSRNRLEENENIPKHSEKQRKKGSIQTQRRGRREVWEKNDNRVTRNQC